MNITRITTLSLPLIALANLTISHAVTLSQTHITGSSGGANYGQEIRLGSEFFSDASYNLNSLEMRKGGLADGGELYVIVYQGIDNAEYNPDFRPNSTDIAGLEFIGTSNNSIDHAGTTTAQTMTWNFTGIELDVDKDTFLVFSESPFESTDFVGSSFLNVGNSGINDISYTNITNANSDPLFGGTGTDNSQENYYVIDVTSTAIPEPSILGLLSLSSLLATRRKRC